MHLYHATLIAEDLKTQLEPYCEIIHIAGSIRRKKEIVKDIELVCIPRRISHEQNDLFGDLLTKTIVVHPKFDTIIKSAGTLIKGQSTGRMMKVELKKQIEGFQYTIDLDLFMPQPHDYYRQLAIRTGSAEYSRRFIAIPWIKKGWCGTEYGLRKISECYKVSESKWVMKPEFGHTPTLPPVWKSEEDFFKWLGVQYLDPEHRSL